LSHRYFHSRYHKGVIDTPIVRYLKSHSYKTFEELENIFNTDEFEESYDELDNILGSQLDKMNPDPGS
jgi:hypothetical protein